MSRVAYVADIHNGNHKRFGGAMRGGVNERGALVVDTLKRAITTSVDCDAFVILGDVFDYVDVEPQLEAAVQDALSLNPKQRKIALIGNHDQGSTSKGDHALGPLRPVVEVIEEPTVLCVEDTLLVCVPFTVGPVLEWLPSTLEKLKGAFVPGFDKQLCLHVGISDEETPAFLTGGSSIHADALFEIMAAFGIETALSGDWHRHQVWTRGSSKIVQVGCLAPTRFPPNNHEHAAAGPMVVVDGAASVVVLDVPGPRFFKMRVGDVWTYKKKDGDKVFVKVLCLPSERVQAKEWLDTMQASGVVDGFVIDVEREDSRAEADVAQAKAATSKDVDSALKEFVEHMPIPDGVDRQVVLSQARSYLTR